MKEKIINALIWLAIIGIVIFWTWFLEWMAPGTPFQAFFASLICCTPITIGIFLCLRQIKWRYDNDVDLFATLETDKGKLKEHMLFIMQYHGIEENLKELNEIFRNYPQWHLEDWVVFRSWYKEQIDHMLKYSEIYGLTMKSTGEPYCKEKDSLYDPEAPDWEQFDRPRYDDIDDDDDDDDYDYGDGNKKSKASDALAVGMGIGIVSGLTGGSVFGVGSSGN